MPKFVELVVTPKQSMSKKKVFNESYFIDRIACSDDPYPWVKLWELLAE